MTRRSRASSLLVICMTTACGAEPAPTPKAMAAATSPAPAVEPIALTVGTMRAELRRDGKVVTRGKTVALLVGDRVDDPSGKMLVQVDGSGLLTGPAVGREVQITAGDELLGEDGARFAIRADGVVVQVSPSGTSTPTEYRFEGVTTKTRRTALLLFVIAMMQASRDETGPGAGTGPR